MQDERNLANAKVDELRGAAHEWWSVADNLTRSLQAMRGSNSWRLTWPLRQARRLARRLGALPARAARKAGRSLRLAATSLLHGAMRAALAHPGITAGTLRLLARRPRLKQALQRVAARAGLIQRHSAQAPSTRPPIAAGQLVPRAARIHAQFERAVEESKD